MHLNREVDGEWIERGCPNQAQEVVEEWEYHGDHGCDYDITWSPHQPEEVDGVSAEAWNIHIIFCGYEFVVWPSLSAARLDKAEYWLAKNLETEKLDSWVHQIIVADKEMLLENTKHHMINDSMKCVCYLVSSDEMDGDADVGEVDQPEGLVEAETGEEVSGSIVSKRGVAKATT